MQDTSLSNEWQDKAAGQEEPAAYTSPCVIHRRRYVFSCSVDRGVQFALQPEGNGLYALRQIAFLVQHGTFKRTPAPEVLETLATGLTAEDALKQVYRRLNDELNTAVTNKDYAPQVIRGGTAETFRDAPELKKMAEYNNLQKNPGFIFTFNRLSSDWGQKTGRYRDLPRAHPNHNGFW